MTQATRAADETVAQILGSLSTPLSDGIDEAIAMEAHMLCADGGSFLVDSQSEWLLGYSSAVLSYHRIISEQTTNPDESKRLIGDALVRSAEEGRTSYVEARLGVRLDDPESAFDRIADSFIDRGESRFGKTFRYVQELLDKEHCFVRIETCFFDRFFRLHQAEDLTPLLCRLDIVWAEELHRRCPTVEFSRPTTLAAGDDACRFQFLRVNKERS